MIMLVVLGGDQLLQCIAEGSEQRCSDGAVMVQ